MKTKFSQLLKLKKDAMEKKEREVAVANGILGEIEAAAQAILGRIASLQVEKSGTGADFRAYVSLRKMELALLEENQKKLSAQKGILRALKDELSALRLEFEQVNALHVREEKALVAALLRHEKRALDEVSIMLFNNKQRGG